jgi:putative aldouronate transport system substrate-binding protein
MSKLTRRDLLKWSGLASVGALIAACRPQVVEKEVTKVVTEVVKETVIVEGTPQVVEKEVTRIVEVAKAAERPILITFCDSQAFGAPHFHSTIDPIAKAISDKMQDEGLNIQLQVLIMDDPRTEYPLLYAAGSQFTFAFDAQWYHMITNIQQGYLLPMEDLFAEHGPNIVEAVGGEPVLEINKMYGHLYGLPTGGIYKAGTGIIIREDLRAKHDLPVPGMHFEDVEPFLEAIQQAEPDMIPFAVDYTQTISEGQFHYTDPERPWSPYSQSRLTFDDALADEPTLVKTESLDRFLYAKEVARDWYLKGYLNKNALQLQQPAVHELFTPGKAAAIRYQEPAQKRYDVEMALQSFVPEGECRGYDTTGLVTGESKHLANLRVWNFVVWHSKVPMDESIAAVQFFNWLLGDQDNIDIWLYGIDGVNHHLLPDMRYEQVEGTDGATNYFRKWFSGGVPFGFTRTPAFADENYVAEVKALTSMENFIPNPLEGFQFDPKPVETEIAQITAATEATGRQLDAGMVDVEEGLAAYTKAIDDAGREKVAEEILRQFEAWRAEQ